MREAKFSKNQLQRYPVYLKYLIGLREEGAVYVSSTRIGQALGYSEEQVRKDLQAVSEEGGRPRKGRKVESLIETLEAFLGYREADSAILIGAGSLGSALLRYPSFRDMGLDIKAAFDVDPRKVGLRIGDVPVYPIEDMERLARGLAAGSGASPPSIFPFPGEWSSRKSTSPAPSPSSPTVWIPTPCVLKGGYPCQRRRKRSPRPRS